MEKGFTVDKEEFKAYMNAQKELARKNRKLISSMNLQNELLINYKEESKFVGYDKLGLETEVLAIMKDNNFVDTCSEDCYIFLKENPFYAESGGQVSDSGYLKNDKFEGNGVYHYANGNRWKGKFKKGKRHKSNTAGWRSGSVLGP